MSCLMGLSRTARYVTTTLVGVAGVGEGMFFIDFHWICAAGLSESLPHPNIVYSVANQSFHLKSLL